LWIETGQPFEEEYILQSGRIGLNTVPEPWRSIPWRFFVDREALDG
jgi:hypothetical protein